MKRLGWEEKVVYRTSRKGNVRRTRSSGHSGRARAVKAAHAQVGSRFSRRSKHNTATLAESSQTAERLRSEALFRTAIRSFELGARAFRKQNYERAREIFEKLASSGVAGVAERARVRLRLCEQKLNRPGRPPKNAEELYTLGVGALNSGRFDEAIEYLKKAQKSAPKVEHIRYALAAAYALRGDAETALQHLRVAISLRPQNRIQAKHDDDFQALAADARFKKLVFASNP